jgi:hypothetical protein
LQDPNVDDADNPVAKPSVKPQLTHWHNVDVVDNLAAKSSVPLKHSPMPLPKPPQNPKTIASLLDMPDDLQETSLPLLPRLKTIQKDTTAASALQKMMRKISPSVMPNQRHNVADEVNHVAKPSVMPTLKQRHNVDGEVSPVASLDVPPRPSLKLFLSQSQRLNVEDEDNLVERQREMLTLWLTQLRSLSLPSKPITLLLGSSTHIIMPPLRLPFISSDSPSIRSSSSVHYITSKYLRFLHDLLPLVTAVMNSLSVGNAFVRLWLLESFYATSDGNGSYGYVYFIEIYTI